ncbi:Zig-1 [Aphelenchoides bicaudatus]|nr:Zig-1 [Aphelenchoides bicaudatus]
MEIRLASVIWRCWLLFCLCFLLARTTVAQYASALSPFGPTSVVLAIETSKGSNGIMAGIGTLSLWCQALDPQTRRPVQIKYGNQRIEAKLSGDKLNASLVREKTPAVESGIWKFRPVIHANTSLRIDEKDGSKTRYDVTGATVVRGEKAQLHCPVHSYPKSDVVWRFGDNRQILGSGDTFTIESVSDQNDGTYVCTASNTISINGNRQRYELVVERRLRVKSEYAWLLPLSIILLIILLLVATIVCCEFQKRRNEQKLILNDDE